MVEGFSKVAFEHWLGSMYEVVVTRSQLAKNVVLSKFKESFGDYVKGKPLTFSNEVKRVLAIATAPAPEPAPAGILARVAGVFV